MAKASGVGRTGAVSSAKDFKMETNSMDIQSIWFSYVEHFWEEKSVMKSETLTTGIWFLFNVFTKTKAEKPEINIYIRCKINQQWQVVWQPNRGDQREENGKSLSVKRKIRYPEGDIFKTS